MSKDEDDFNRRCGKILRSSLSVESNLEFFLANYFIQSQNHKTFLLQDSLANGCSFEFKIQLFQRICEHEKNLNDELSNTINSIRFVQNKRNIVAHHEAIVHDTTNPAVKLRKRSHVGYAAEIEITDDLVEQVKSNCIVAIHGITKIYLELSKNKREIG